MKVGFETVVRYHPDTVIKRSHFSYLDAIMSEEEREMFKGPDERRVLKDDNAVEILGEKVARKALDSAGLTTSDIDFIIAQNYGGKHIMPLVGSGIHNKLGFSKETNVLNIHNDCAGFIDGCHVAWDLLLSGEYKRILVVMVAAWLAKGWGIDQTGLWAKVFGDGAGAAIVSSQNLKCEFLSYYGQTYSELYGHVCIDLMPPANPELLKKAGVQATTMGNYQYGDQYLYNWQEREGKGQMLEGVTKALKKANLTLSDLDMVILHQAMPVLHERWIAGMEEAGVSRGKFKEYWHKYGNMGCVDIAAILAELWEKGQLPRDSTIFTGSRGTLAHHDNKMVGLEKAQAWTITIEGETNR
jgi:3-oxoacyl-[acyl-carrier-protein] synthase-3